MRNQSAYGRYCWTVRAPVAPGANSAVTGAVPRLKQVLELENE
jgi:hypothetical protein